MLRAELMGALNELVCCWLFVEPNPPPVLLLPNKPPVVFPPPKAGFGVDPNKPPLEVLLLLSVLLPNPPNPLVVPAVAVPPPKRPPPLEVVEAPKAGRF